MVSQNTWMVVVRLVVKGTTEALILVAAYMNDSF